MALYGSSQSRLPENVARIDIKSLETAVEIPDEDQASGSRNRAGMQRGALLMAPDFFHGVCMIRTHLTEVAVGSRHFKELAACCQTASPLYQRDFACSVFKAGLAQWRDDET